MASGEGTEFIFRLYDKAGILTRVYVRIKLRICPVLALESYLPKEGKILDLGCGVGIFSNILSLLSPARKVEGIDADSNKIKAAGAASGGRGNLTFSARRMEDFRGSGYDAIVISDALYLVPYARQEEVLKNCFSGLSDKGVLLIKEVDKRPLWKFIFNLVQETLAVRVLRFTKAGGFFFRSRSEYESLLSGIGFKVEVLSLDKGFAYPHIAYLCRKTTAGKS
jgi:2-polyprenyl-6-hydroxyphenyl methylase/3-demethylubiquinone-9 3-methyltransferase